MNRFIKISAQFMINYKKSTNFLSPSHKYKVHDAICLRSFTQSSTRSVVLLIFYVKVYRTSYYFISVKLLDPMKKK